MHKALKKEFDCELTYPDYHPHITIAYLKKGKAKKYMEGDYDFPELSIETNMYIYSYPPDNRKTFKVNSEKLKEELNKIKRLL